MIEAMRTIALDYLAEELSGGSVPADIEGWYQNLRKNSPGKMFPYLVEDSGKIETVYVLEKYTDDMMRLVVQDLVDDSDSDREKCTIDKLPFMRPSGSQSAQIGPVIKRSYDKNKGGGPSEKILRTTMEYFKEVAQANKPWSPYFEDILKLLNCVMVQLPDGEKVNWQKSGYANLLACAVDKIGKQSGTVFLTVRDSKGQLPGENALYVEYLLTEKLAGERYATQKAPAEEKKICCLCNVREVTVFPNALKGAGINLSNVDRAGAFPGIDTLQAWKKYALCSSCADLLYVYKFHVLKKGGPKKDHQPFGARIAGENALIIPSFLPGLPAEARLDVLHETTDYIKNMASDVEQDEDSLLDILKDNESILNFIILWADIGQEIGNVTGMITNVLPSRLRKLSELNAQAERWTHPLFPKVPLQQGRTNFKPDLSLKALRPLFHRPSGEKAKDANKSKQLFHVKRLIAACVYHQNRLLGDRFWEEIMTTARWYWLEALERKDGHRELLYEGIGKSGPYLTAAGWLKHLNWWLYYFKQVGVMDMEKVYFEPDMDVLKPYFGPESGIDTQEKAFSFLLGVLYGKLLQVQGARGVNVGANALSWLKRLTLQGKDLPELYNKTREKLLAYETEKNQEVKMLISEIGRLGVKLGDNIRLSEIQTNYYLLLGQSMTVDILPSKEQN
ncbi:CRISPR-associated protein [candidate division WS5 bacterium]|uniref:CRISPR-associated protein n=1 Tax=candidate division WS5 bacterium TaxID=2093353 RepID=A0A419DBY3_9BACT|nr:MAG: CRISPR-associated protein [candidate division WS5 bacterium]